jgi:hypothetical protein
MMLIVYYVIFVIAGDLSDYLIGLIVEREFGSQVSLLVFLALYFVILWLAWLFAVWMTEPKRARASLHGGSALRRCAAALSASAATPKCGGPIPVAGS